MAVREVVRALQLSFFVIACFPSYCGWRGPIVAVAYFIYFEPAVVPAVAI